MTESTPTDIHYHLPPKPQYPLGHPSHNKHPVDSWRSTPSRTSSVESPEPQTPPLPPAKPKTFAKHDKIFDKAVSSISKRPRQEEPNYEDYKQHDTDSKVKVRKVGEDHNSREEGTRVVYGQMEDDTPFKKRIDYEWYHASSSVPSTPSKVLEITTDPCKSEPANRFVVQDTPSVNTTSQGYIPPSPRITPINTRFFSPVAASTVIDIANILTFLAETSENPQFKNPSLLPDLSEQQKQALIAFRSDIIKNTRLIGSLKASEAELQKEVNNKDLAAKDLEVRIEGLELDRDLIKSKYNNAKLALEKKDKIIQDLNTELVDTKTAHSKEIESWKDQCTRLFNVKEELEEEKKALLEEGNSKQAEHETLEKDYQSIKDRLTELEGSNKVLKVELDNMTAEKESSKREVEEKSREFTIEIARLKKSNKSLEDEIYCTKSEKEVLEQMTEGKLEESKKQIEELNTQKLKMATEITNHVNFTTKLKTDLQILNNETGALKSSNTELQLNLEASELVMTENLKEIERLTSELENISSEAKKADGLEKSLELLGKEYGHSQEKLNDLTVSLGEVKADNQQLTSQRNSLNNDIVTSKEKTQKLQSDLARAVIEKETLQTEINTLLTQKADLEKQSSVALASNLTDSTSEQQEIDLLSGNIEKLQEEVSRLEGEVEDAKELQLSTEESMGYWMELAQQREMANDVMEKQIAKFEKLQAEGGLRTKKGKSPLARTSTVLIQTNNDKVAFKQTIQRLESERIELIGKVESLTKQVTEVKGNLMVKEIEKVACEVEINGMKDKLASCEEVVEAKSKEIENLNTQLKDLGQGVDPDLERKQLEEKINVMSNTKTALEAKVKSLESINKTFRNEIDTLKKQSKSKSNTSEKLLLQKQIQESQQRVTNIQLSLATKEAELEKCKDLRKNLDRRITNLDNLVKDKDRVIKNGENKLKEQSDSFRMERIEYNKKLEEKDSLIRISTESLEQFKIQLSTISQMKQNEPTISLNHNSLFRIKEIHSKLCKIRNQMYDNISIRTRYLKELIDDNYKFRISTNYKDHLRDERDYQDYQGLLNKLYDWGNEERNLSRLLQEAER